MAMPYDARDRGLFTRIGSGSQPTRTTRSWSSNGVHYTVDTTSFSTPGISLGAMSGSAGTLNSGRGFNTPTPVRPAVRSGGPGLFGNAFGLLEDMLSMQHHSQPRRRSPDPYVNGNMGQHNSTSGRRRVHYGVDSDDDEEDGLAYEYESGRSRPKSVFSRIKDKLLDGSRPNRQSCNSSNNSRNSRDGPGQSPPRRPTPEQRRASYRTETREPSWERQQQEQQPQHGRPAPQYIEVDEVEEDGAPVYEYHPRRTSPMDPIRMEALENAAERERRSVRACKKRLEQATRQPAVSSHHLQQMLNELKGHENALMNAQASLDEARAKQRSSRNPQPQPQPHAQAQPRQRPASYHPRSGSQQRPQPQQRHSARTLEEEFFSPFGGFSPFFQPGRNPDPLLRAFGEMNSFEPFGRTGFGMHEQIFEQMRPTADDAHFHFFTNAGTAPSNNDSSQRKRTRFSMPNGGGPQFYQQSNPAFVFEPAPAPPHPEPPANLLKVEEAKRLFKTYNDEWNALPTTSPDIPYPTRTLKASALSARDSIFAPLCTAHPTTWSEETIMQANAQAFFLGVVGLVPQYKEAPGTGSIQMRFDRSQASEAQIKRLTDMLKKEKCRWHSDRLGRRNGGAVTGAMTVNEGLQRDERARAVFHAVCGLMESV